MACVQADEIHTETLHPQTFKTFGHGSIPDQGVDTLAFRATKSQSFETMLNSSSAGSPLQIA